MPLFPTKRHGRLRAGGFTLLEIVVTLVLLGLAAAMVAPAFRTETAPDEGFRSILALTREAAVRRSQTLVLQVDGRGAWRIAADGDSTPIADGRFTDGTKELRIRVNPLGACFNDGAAGTVGLDAIACTVSGPGTGGR